MIRSERLYTKFCNQFNIDASEIEPSYISHELTDLLSYSKEAKSFIEAFSGKTFGNGLYRIHKADEIVKWSDIISEMFPKFSNNILCFSYDWLGRHFALDYRRKKNNEPLILMLEPGTGEALEIPATFFEFHEEEIIEYQEEALAVSFFNQWKNINDELILPTQCVGYKVPLFIGGKDSIENLEISDMEVYWEICTQLINKVRNLPLGTSLKEIKIT